MKIVSYILLFVGLLIAQIKILPYFSIGYFVPDVLFVGVIILGIREGGIPAMITGCLVGFSRDAFTSFWGSSMISLVIAGFLAGVYSRNRQRMGAQGNLLFLFVTAFVYHLVYYFLYLFGADFNVVTILLRYVFPAAIYTLIIAGIIHFLIPKGLWGEK